MIYPHSSFFPPQQRAMATIEDLVNVQALTVVSRFHLKDEQFRLNLKSFLHTLKSTIEAIPATKGKSFSSDWLACSIFTDLPTIASSIKSLQAPGKISLIGSHILNIQTIHSPNADLYLEAPEGFYHKQDLHDAIYHKKRFIYLCFVADQIKKTHPDLQLSFTHLKTLRPLLQIRKDDSVCIQIHLGVISLTPPNWNEQLLSKSFFDSRLAIPQVPTPRYACSIAQDFFFLEHLAFIHASLKEVTNLQSACILLKAWLHCKDIQLNFAFTMLAAILYQKGYFNRDSSCFKIFAQILKFVATNAENYLFDSVDKEKSIRYSEGAVLIDSTGNLNLFSELDQGILRYLSQEAKDTLGLLSVYSVYPDKSFDQIFGEKLPLFDLEINLDQVDLLDAKFFTSKRFLSMLGSSGDRYRTVLFWIPWMLNKALSDRVSCVRCTAVSNQIILKIRYTEHSTANNLVFKGPLNDEKDKAAFFRSLWGSLTELKRYANGAIHEVVNCPSEEQYPVYYLAAHLLHLHASLPSENILLSNTKLFTAPIPFGVRTIPELKEVFIQLHQALKNVPEVAAVMENLLPLSSCFRGTSLETPRRLAKSEQLYGQEGKNSESLMPIVVGIQFQSNLPGSPSEDALIAMQCSNLFKLYQHFTSRRNRCSMSTDPYLEVEFQGYLFRIITLPGDDEWEAYHAYKAIASTNARFTSNPLYSNFVVVFKKWLECNLLLECVSTDELEFIPELIVCKFFLEHYATMNNYSMQRLATEFFSSLDRHLSSEITLDYDSFCLLQRDFLMDASWVGPIAQSFSKVGVYLKSHFPTPLTRKRVLHLARRLDCNQPLSAVALGDFDFVMEKLFLNNAAVTLSRVNLHREALRMVEAEFKNCLFFPSSTYVGIVLDSPDNKQKIIKRLSCFYRPIDQ